MDDRQLEQLVRMAMEAEELERSADASLLLTSPRRSGGRLWLGIGVSAAAAAAALALTLSMAAYFNTPPAPVGPLAGGPRAADPDSGHSTEPVAAQNPEECVVMAFYQTADGDCSCLNLSTHEWDGGRRLADVARTELFDVAFRQQCSTQAQQVFVVAVAGKPGTLPTTRDEAEAIGARLASAPQNRNADLSTFAYTALPELPANSTVVAERMAIRPASPVGDSLAAMVSKVR